MANVNNMFDLILNHLDEQLPCQWEIRCENIKKHDNQQVKEFVAEYKELSTLHEIYLKLANFSISTLGFFSTITLYKKDAGVIPPRATSIKLVNLPPTIVSDMYITLIAYGIYGDLEYKDDILSFEFYRSGTSFSLNIWYNIIDCTKNAKIIESLYKFIQFPHFVEAYDPEQFQPSIDFMMKQPFPDRFDQKLAVKNTFDSAENAFDNKTKHK